MADTQLPACRVTNRQAWIARQAGGGVLSKGVRVALDVLSVQPRVLMYLKSISSEEVQSETLVNLIREAGFTGSVEAALGCKSLKHIESIGEAKPSMKLNSHGEMLLCQLLNKLDALLENVPDTDTVKVPTDLLREMCEILAGDGTMPGLEDYVSGNYRED